MTTARVLRIFTTTPGFTATIYARKDQPPLTWPDSGWAKVSAATVVSHKQDIQLTGSARSTGSTSCGSRASGGIRAWRWMR